MNISGGYQTELNLKNPGKQFIKNSLSVLATNAFGS